MPPSLAHVLVSGALLSVLHSGAALKLPLPVEAAKGAVATAALSALLVAHSPAAAFDIPGVGNVELPSVSLPSSLPSVSLPTSLPSVRLPSLSLPPSPFGEPSAEEKAAQAAQAQASAAAKDAKEARRREMMRVRAQRTAEESRKQSDEYVARQAIVGAMSFGSTTSVPRSDPEPTPDAPSASSAAAAADAAADELGPPAAAPSAELAPAPAAAGE